MMMNKNRKKLNNQGSALIVSIIVLLFVSILATVILYIAGVNYRMKKNELKTKVAFYSGEVYLERMQANLIIPVSEAMDTAYRNTNCQYFSCITSHDSNLEFPYLQPDLPGWMATTDAENRREMFYRYSYQELKDILLDHYGADDEITNDGPAPADSAFVKNIIHNITSAGPASGDGIDVSHVYVNDGTMATYQHYDSATQFIDKILLSNSHAFDGDADPNTPVYYVVVYGQLNQGGATADDKQNNNFKEFVGLDIKNPATGNLADPDKCRIVFKNVCVVCVQNGYRSVISTDLAVQFPPLDWDNGTSTDPVTYWNAFQMFYYINWKNN